MLAFVLGLCLNLACVWSVYFEGHRAKPLTGLMLRINLNIEGCGTVAAPVHAPSRAPLLLPLRLSHYPSPSRSDH